MRLSETFRSFGRCRQDGRFASSARSREKLQAATRWSSDVRSTKRGRFPTSSVRLSRWVCCRLCLCLLAGAWLSMRAQKRVEEVNKRVQRIIAGDLRERLPYHNVDEPFSKLAVIVNGMLDEMGNDDPRARQRRQRHRSRLAHAADAGAARARTRPHQHIDGRAAPDGCRQGDRKYRSVAGHHHGAVASC